MHQLRDRKLHFLLAVNSGFRLRQRVHQSEADSRDRKALEQQLAHDQLPPVVRSFAFHYFYDENMLSMIFQFLGERSDEFDNEGMRAYFRRDYDAAVELLRTSAANGNLNSLKYLGICAFNGLGVEKNLFKAARYFERAAEQGHAPSFYWRGQCLRQAIGVEGNLEEGARVIKGGADRGHIESMYMYALLLAHGSGVERDDEEALKYFRKAAELGHGGAAAVMQAESWRDRALTHPLDRTPI